MARGPRVRPVIDRFADQIALADSGCVEWIGATTGQGYAQIKLTPAEGKRLVYVHRWSYEFHAGPIPDGYEVDHLCRNTLCVNPDHLEAVPPHINNMRSTSAAARNAAKTHCIRNHPLSGSNLLLSKGVRVCRKCKLDRERARMNRLRKAA